MFTNTLAVTQPLPQLAFQPPLSRWLSGPWADAEAAAPLWALVDLAAAGAAVGAAPLVVVPGLGDVRITTLARILLLTGFVLVTIGAVALSDRPLVRRSYVAGFFACLLLVNAVGVAALPFVHWHKFSAEGPTVEVDHQFRVVDAAGRELDYDHRATLGADGVSMYLIHSRLDEYDDAQRAAVAGYLFERAVLYREAVESRSALHLVRFPPHDIENTWDTPELAGYDAFVGIRLYRIEFVSDAAGTGVESRSETVLEEWRFDDRTLAGPDGSVAVAPPTGSPPDALAVAPGADPVAVGPPAARTARTITGHAVVA
jgi:hypothetical protein